MLTNLFLVAKIILAILVIFIGVCVIASLLLLLILIIKDKIDRKRNPLAAAIKDYGDYISKGK